MRLKKWFIGAAVGIGGATAGYAAMVPQNDVGNRDSGNGNTNSLFDSIGAVRLYRAASTVFRITLIYKWHLYGIDKESDRYPERLSVCHRLGAAEFLKLCQSNKGVYVKVGQHIGALDYLLPDEYVKTLQVLHRNAPKNSIEQIKAILKAEFPDRDPDKVFLEMDAEPLGTASLAQVHRAKLANGTTVAVKVQHKFVKQHADSDLKIMESLVNWTKRFFKDLELDWLVDITKTNLPKELDFRKEAENVQKIEKLFKNVSWLKVPKVFADLSTERVLTMEYIEGGHVNDKQFIDRHRIDVNEITTKLGYLYSQMIFRYGFVHGDPHPGNILIQVDDETSERQQSNRFKIVLIDHGLYSDLNEDFRFNYANLWVGILERNHDRIKDFSLRLGMKDDQFFGLLACVVSGRTWNSIMDGIYTKKFTNDEREIFQKSLPIVLPRLMNMLNRVNRQIILILKVNDLLRGIEFSLKSTPQMKSFFSLTKECYKSIIVYKQKQHAVAVNAKVLNKAYSGPL